MKTKNNRSILAASLALAFFSSSASAVTLPVAQDNSSTPTGTFSAATGKATSLGVAPNRTAYVQFDLTKLPPSVTAGSLRNARLRLYTTKVISAGDLSVSDVTTPWSETSAGGAASVGGLIATIPASQLATKRFVVVDVTAEVNNWLSGGANNGIAISSSTANVALGSKEGASTGYPAELEIDINPQGGTVTASALRAPGAGINTGTFAFTHRITAENFASHVTFIFNPLCDGDPDAILIVTHNFGKDTSPNQYHPQAVGVFYTGANWGIISDDQSALEIGDAFNVLVIKP
ncbi:MAG TPA: DNRLRE domain-containing protein [Methylomirabilota bacterium]|nr:DNRLRE domain-containing protein [Methylomirabilota bacterium]